MGKIIGKLIKKLDVETGESKAGKAWTKRTFVIDTGAKFNPEVALSLFGIDKCELIDDIKDGEEIVVSYNLSSREFNEKYYHNIDAWKIEKVTATAVDESDVEEFNEPPF